MIIKIIKAELSDMENIWRLQLEAYQSEAILYNDFTIQPLTQTLEQAILEFNENIILKAVLDDKIIGSVRAYENQGSVYIGKLMVLSAYQNNGIGKRLLEAIEDEFPGKRYELFTGAKSVKNLMLYEKFGYVRFKETKAAEGVSFVYLEKL